MNYEETIELEKNIKIKNEADELYHRFCKSVKLSVSKRHENELEDWSDSHNRTFYRVTKEGISYHCRFLHEAYNVAISPSALFTYIKNDYMGLGHFRSSIVRHEKLMEKV